jgi:hypothetical protein
MTHIPLLEATDENAVRHVAAAFRSAPKAPQTIAKNLRPRLIAERSQHFDRSFVMRRTTALCLATCFAVAAIAATRPAEAGYYVIRWENTGICQIWNEDLQRKPLEWPSTYKVISKPVPTFAAAMTEQEQMRMQRRCNL